MRKHLRLVLAIVLLLLVGAAFVWLSADHDEAGPVNALTPKELAEKCWTLLFDGKTQKGWNIDGNATVQDGLLVLGGDRATTAGTINLYKDFELQFDYRFIVGQQGMLEMKGDGSVSSFGLGFLTSNAGAWNRATFATKNGTSSVEFKPLRKPLFQWVHSGPVLGATGGGGGSPVHIIFNLNIPGNKLAVRSVKLKTVEK